MADDQGGNDAADPRRNESRTGIPGKGFDAGTGYGGGGNNSLHHAESSHGGQSGIGENTARDTDGRGSANDERVADPNVEAVTGAFEGRGASDGASSNDATPASGISPDGPDRVDLDDFSGASRREPGR